MRWSLTILFALTIAAHGVAHDPGLSSARVRIGHDNITIEATFSPADIEAARRLGRSSETLQGLALRAFEVKWGEETSKAIAGEAGTDGRNVFIRAVYTARRSEALGIRLALLSDLAPGHKHYVSIRRENDEELGEAILSRGADSIVIGTEKLRETLTSQAVEFLQLGIEHIWTGYDHLAFLLGVLLAGAGLRSAVRVITSFTVAHSLTLALAATGTIVLPPQIAEPLIAVSIIYVGVENLVHGGLKRGWLVTFAFGLVHGFGFASVLRDLGIAGAAGGIAVPLLSFNLGVEIGQLAVAAVAVPLLWKLQARTQSTRLAPACSVVLTVAGTWWLVQRIALIY